MKSDMKNKDMGSEKKSTDSQITDKKSPKKGNMKNRYSLRSKHARRNNSADKKYSKKIAKDSDSNSEPTSDEESEEDLINMNTKFLSNVPF